MVVAMVEVPVVRGFAPGIVVAIVSIVHEIIHEDRPRLDQVHLLAEMEYTATK